MYAKQLRELQNLLNEWAICEPEDMETIEQKIVEIRENIITFPQKLLKLQTEIQRFNTFQDEQSNLDNILSLLKICNRLEINYDEEIDTKETRPIDMVHNMYCIVEEEWKTKEGIEDSNMSIDDVYELEEILAELRRY